MQRYFRIRELASTPERAGLLPVAPATVWRWVKLGQFPAPVKLSEGVTAWPVEAVERWQGLQAANTIASAGPSKAGAASVAARQARRGPQ